MLNRYRSSSSEDEARVAGNGKFDEDPNAEGDETLNIVDPMFSCVKEFLSFGRSRSKSCSIKHWLHCYV